MLSYRKNHGKEWKSERRSDHDIAGRIEPCDECGQPFRTFCHRPQAYICRPCTKPVLLLKAKYHTVTEPS